jgi:hypothetical protein
LFLLFAVIELQTKNRILKNKGCRLAALFIKNEVRALQNTHRRVHNILSNHLDFF